MIMSVIMCRIAGLFVMIRAYLPLKAEKPCPLPLLLLILQCS